MIGANVSTTALDLIVGAMRNINALEAGETPDPQESADFLIVMNDMLESWSTEKLFVFSSSEQLFIFVPGQYQYTIGNPLVGTINGTVTGSSNLITGVTVPPGLVQGSMLTDAAQYGGQGVLPTGTQAVQVTNIAGTTLTLNQNALLTPAVNPEVIAYSTPGNIAYDSTTGAPITLPSRITNCFTRITTSGGGPVVQSLDYQCRIIPRDKYTALGLKGIAGPWPTDLYYDRTYPLGNLYFYPNPSMGGECHLWVDTPLGDLQTVNAPINFPIGYSRAIKTNLAIELCAELGKTPSRTLIQRAQESKAAIKSLNAVPGVEAFFDQHLLRSRRADAGWILSGGFYS
jgi:hypothetical protein